MLINNPSLELTFTATGNTYTTNLIVLDSISITEQLYNDLNASSDTVSLQLIPDDEPIYTGGPTMVEAIIKETADIKACLKDGTAVLYTGYVSDNYTWGVNITGEDVLQINLEGVGVRLLNKPFANEDGTCIRETFEDLLDLIADKCGNVFLVVYDNIDQATKDKVLINKLNAGTSCQSVLDAVCYELGLIYRFNNYGNLVISKTDLTSQPAVTVASSGTADYYLYTEDKTAVELTKKAKQYKQVRVKYSTIKDSGSVVPVYEVTNNIAVPPLQWWDGQFHTEEVYDLTLDEFFQAGKTYYINTASGWAVATVTVGDPIPDGQYYEYAGAASTVEMQDLNNGKDILYVYPSTVQPNQTDYTTSYVAGGVTYVAAPTGFNNSKWTNRQHNGTDRLDILIDNTLTDTLTTTYTAFRAGARIITKDASASIWRAFDNLTANSENQFDYEAEWIHSKDDAKALAELLNNYYAYCNNTYSFYTEDAIPLGTIVNLNENLISGLNVNVFLTARQYKAYGLRPGLYKYTAQGISAFDLVPTVRGDSVAPSAPGQAMRSITVMYATSMSDQTPPQSGWSTVMPVLNPDTALYLWAQETVTYTDGSTSVTYSVIGSYGDRGLSPIFRVHTSPSNFISNRRRTDSQTFTISCEVQGYTGTPTIHYWFDEVDPENPQGGTADSYTFQIPYDNSYSSLIIEATLAGAPTQTYTVKAIDETEEYLYFGQFHIDTEDYFDADGNPVFADYSLIDWSPVSDTLASNEKFLAGDSFFNNYTSGDFEDVYLYVYENSMWIPINFSVLSNSTKSKILAQAQKDILSSIPAGSVTKSDYGYFNTIVAGTVTADYIGGKEIEVHDGGYLYAGDVDLTQPAGQRVLNSGTGFCFDSLGNAEMANIRITGDSTIEGGSTVLGTLINYDTNGDPVFKTVKDSAATATMAGSKTDGTDTPNAYLWSEFRPYLYGQITNNLTSGTTYTATGTMRGTWSGNSVSGKTIKGVNYYATAPSTAVVQDPQYGQPNGITGNLASNQVETKTIWTNTRPNTVIFSEVQAYPKTESGPFGTQTQAGSFSVDICYASGSIYRTIIDVGTQGPSASTGGFDRTVSNVEVPPGYFIQARWGTWGWSRRGSQGWVKMAYRESDNFTQGINLITNGGTVYNADNVIPDTASYSTNSQSLTVTGTSVSLNIAMSASSNWPVEKYYRFSYSTPPGTSSMVTTSVFSSQSFSYRGVPKTIVSITYSNSLLKVTDTNGNTYDFSTAAGYYYPRHSFSFTALAQNLGAYMRSCLPTDDANVHDIGGAGTYASTRTQRWNTGFFTSLDVSQGIHAQTINASWNVPIITANTTLTDDIPVGFMKPYFIVASDLGTSVTVTLPSTGTYEGILLRGAGVALRNWNAGATEQCSGNTLMFVLRMS